MKEVNAAIITIGDELLIGQTIDTNSAFIAQELNKIGVWVKRRIAVGDAKEEIIKAINDQIRDNEIVIITGGLGPTADDITKPALCDYFRSTLIVDEGVLQNVNEIFLKLNRPILDVNLKQAEVPHNCIVLPNKRGTAPGMLFHYDFTNSQLNQETLSDVLNNNNLKIIVSLPGVPHEMTGLIKDEVIPRIMQTFSLPVLVHKTLLTAGLGESFLADKISEFEQSLPLHIKLAYLPAYGMVRLRLTGRKDDKAELEAEINHLFENLKKLVNEWLVVDEDVKLEEVIIQILREKKKTIATAESCTGGFISHLITSVPGSSDVFKGSIVSYANEAKENVLKVKPETINTNGAVSEETVKEMAEGALTTLNTDYVIATSGIMGPGGGTEIKPVGTVWIAVGNEKEIKTTKLSLRFDRSRNIELTGLTALNLLRKFILEN